MAKTVIYGGTFNPIHNAHIEVMQCLCGLSDVETLLIIPTAIPPHKSYKEEVSAEHRLEMCRIASKGMTKAKVSDMEIARKGKSYTIDTVNTLLEIGCGELCVACGGDMLVTLDTWKNYRELISKVEIIALYRVGTDETEFDEYVKKITADGGRVRIVNAKITDVASKRIRLALQAGDDVSHLVPREIYDYIKQNGLYFKG